MRRRIYVAATAIATVVVVGIAAAQETPTAPAPVVRTPQERGVVSDTTRATTTEQAALVRTPAERGLGADALTRTELDPSLPAIGTAVVGTVPLFIDPSGPTATPQLVTAGALGAAAPATVIVIVPSPTTASPATADTGTGSTFVDSTTASPLFEASQQARRDARSR